MSKYMSTRKPKNLEAAVFRTKVWAKQRDEKVWKKAENENHQIHQLKNVVTEFTSALH